MRDVHKGLEYTGIGFSWGAAVLYVLRATQSKLAFFSAAISAVPMVDKGLIPGIRVWKDEMGSPCVCHISNRVISD